MFFIVSVNSLLNLKKAFFNILLGYKRLSYPHLNAHDQAFKDKLVF